MNNLASLCNMDQMHCMVNVQILVLDFNLCLVVFPDDVSNSAFHIAYLVCFRHKQVEKIIEFIVHGD